MSSTSHGTTPFYYVPEPSPFPALASLGLFFVILGATFWVNDIAWGKYSLLAGMVIWLFTLFQWFSASVAESESGL
jgi:cytochrome c oxidase subunit 3